MKPIKNYSFKIAILLITLGSMVILYWYWSYKKFDEKCIPQNADEIVMLDVKNIRNYFIFSFIKNPSQWHWETTEAKKQFALSNYGLETLDYFAFFHLENSPLNQWFTVAKIENETEFEKATVTASFIKKQLKNGLSSYSSKSMGLFIIKHSNQILISNIPEKQKEIAVKVAEDLFLKKLLLDIKKFEKTIGTTNAITVWIKKNNYLEDDGIININLKEQEIIADGQLQLKPKYQKESQFSQNPNAILALGFDFEMIRDQNIFKTNSDQINKMIGFDLDSVLIHHPSKTELLLNKIIEKKDSAISYDYDDDFNPVKRVVVRTSREPSFYFSIQTEDSKQVYNYLKKQNAIDNHQFFVNFPLAPTKAFIKNNALTLVANFPKCNALKSTPLKIAYLRMHFDKLQDKDWRFLIAKNKNFGLLKPFETLEIELKQENNSSQLKAHFKTKNRKNWFEIIK